MNLRDDFKDLKTGVRDLRKFGLTVGGVFAALGLVLLWRGRPTAPYFLWPGGGLMVFGALLPRALKYVYLAWMGLALVMGAIMARVILIIVFLLVMTPIGLVARLVGKDFLNLKWNRAAPSYWIKRDGKVKSAAEYERQF